MQWYNIVCVCSIVACRAVIQVELTEWFAFFACPVDEFSVKLMPPESETERFGASACYVVRNFMPRIIREKIWVKTTRDCKLLTASFENFLNR